jgi:RNA polymerase sigma factor (TIGR02999 family)
MNEVTILLSAIDKGDPRAAEQLLPLVYDELRKLAAQRLAQEKPGQTLQATALVHEAYLRLTASPGRKSGESDKSWDSRGHFFIAAAEAMRRILIDQARKKRRPKHGGDRQRLELDLLVLTADNRADDLLALDDALATLAQREPVKAELNSSTHN